MVESQLQLTGAFGRDEALGRLRGKYSQWLDLVGTPALYRLCLRLDYFTSDDLWEEFERFPAPCERRVMGALIRGFALKGLITKTSVFEKSRMPACHARDKAVWRSNLCLGGVA